jgi:glycosyltransferase involved in cell wall biosynthesis
MKVAMVTRDLNFGIGAHTKQLVKELRNQGVEVNVHLGKGNYRTNVLVEKVSKRNDYAVVHVQGSPFGAFGSARVPRTVTVHSLLSTELLYEKKLNYKIGLYFERATLAMASKIIAVSDVVRSELLELHVPEEKIAVIPNAIDVDEFCIDVPKERPAFVFTCGRNVKRKDFETFKRACEIAQVPFRISHGELSREETIRTFMKASVFVMPSLYEPFGIVLLEAMAAKTPVISSDIPAVQGLVIQNQTGLLFEKGSVDDLVESLLCMLSSEELRAQLAENAFEHIKKNFNWKDVAKKTIEVYEEVLQ